MRSRRPLQRPEPCWNKSESVLIRAAPPPLKHPSSHQAGVFFFVPAPGIGFGATGQAPLPPPPPLKVLSILLTLPGAWPGTTRQGAFFSPHQSHTAPVSPLFLPQGPQRHGTRSAKRKAKSCILRPNSSLFPCFQEVTCRRHTATSSLEVVQPRLPVAGHLKCPLCGHET